jgi:nucleotide-binding universal stress UspA family protein
MFSSILVAWDGSSHARRALEEAVDIARSQGARLTLLTVATPARRWMGTYAVPVSADDLSLEAERIVAEGEALIPADVPYSTRTAEGHPGKELLARTTAARHDLIVMGSRGRGAFRSAVLGSVSHYILNHADVPVLIVHCPREEEPEGPQDRVANTPA